MHKPGQWAHARRYEGLIHLTDWLPTFMGLAGVHDWAGAQAAKGVELDGFDVWDALTSNAASPRTTLLHNLDTSETWGSAIRVGDYKLIIAQAEQEWFPLPGSSGSGALTSAIGVNVSALAPLSPLPFPSPTPQYIPPIGQKQQPKIKLLEVAEVPFPM